MTFQTASTSNTARQAHTLKVILHPYNALTPSKFQVSRFPANP